MTEKVVLEIVTKTSASGTGGESTGAGVSGKGSLGVLGMIGKLAIIGKLLTDMLYVFKPVLSMLSQIAKLIGMFLQPIAEVMVILLRPILILLRPILMVFRLMMQPFMKLIRQAGVDMAQAAAEGNTGAVMAFGNFIIGTLIKPLVLILANELGKVLLDGIGLLSKVIVDALITVVTALLMVVTVPLDLIINLIKLIVKGVLQLAKIIVSIVPGWLMGNERKDSITDWLTKTIESIDPSQLSITDALLGSAKDLVASVNTTIDTGIANWKDTMDQSLQINLANMALNQSEKLTELENKFSMGLTTAVEKPITTLVTNLNNITAKLNQPSGSSATVVKSSGGGSLTSSKSNLGALGTDTTWFLQYSSNVNNNLNANNSAYGILTGQSIGYSNPLLTRGKK